MKTYDPRDYSIQIGDRVIDFGAALDEPEQQLDPSSLSGQIDFKLLESSSTLTWFNELVDHMFSPPSLILFELACKKYVYFKHEAKRRGWVSPSLARRTKAARWRNEIYGGSEITASIGDAENGVIEWGVKVEKVGPVVLDFEVEL